MHNPHNAQIYSPEAKALRELRQQRRNAPGDPLVKRMHSVAFWRECLKTNSGYCEPQSRAFYRTAPFRRYLLPKLAATLAAQERAAKEALHAQHRAESAAWEAKKAAAQQQRDAARKLAKKLAASPVADMFGASA